MVCWLPGQPVTGLRGQARALTVEPSKDKRRWTLTSRHQVLPQHWHPEVAGQRGQVGPYAGELLTHFRGLCAEVAEGTQAHDAMGMVSEDVVPGGQQVVSLHQLQGKAQVRGNWPGGRGPGHTQKVEETGFAIALGPWTSRTRVTLYT